MKKLLLLLAFLGWITNARSQDVVAGDESSDYLYEWGEFSLGVSGIYIDYPEFITRTGFGLTLHNAVSENVVLNWHLYFGDRYFSTSVWVPLGPLLFIASAANGNVSKGALGLLLLSALPDGVSFPIKLTDKVFITPTISPLNLDMFGKDPALKRFYINGNIALGLHFKGKYFNVHPYGAMNLLYKSAPNFGFSGGLEIELRLNSIRP